MDKKLAKFQQEVLDKMFKMVGFNGFDRAFTKKYDNWYQQKTWTEAESESFHLFFKALAKKELKWTDRTIEKEYQYFNLMWGWKIK